MSKSVYIEQVEMKDVGRGNEYKYVLNYDAPTGFSIERVEHGGGATWYVVMVPERGEF